MMVSPPLRKLFWFGALLIAAIAVFMPAPNAEAGSEGPQLERKTEHWRYVQWHIDAYGSYGHCRAGGGLEADSQNNYSRCKGIGGRQAHDDPFTGHVEFSWHGDPVPRCYETHATREHHFTKQVLISRTDDAHALGVLCGFTKQNMSSAALVVPGDHAVLLNGHWRYPSTGSNPHEAGHKGGPLYMNLIHRREGFHNNYTLSIRGWLKYDA